MYQEVEKFFLAFFGENFETSVLQAFFVCFTLMLVYGIIVRPFINLINGKQKRSFFDTITITLIILIGVKILFPTALTFEQNVNVTVENVSGNINQEDEKLDLPEYSSVDDFVDDSGLFYDETYNETSDSDLMFAGSPTLYANSSNISVEEPSYPSYDYIGEPFAYIDGELWYKFYIEYPYIDCGYYRVLTDCRFICLEPYT